MKLKYGPYSPSRLERGICPYAFGKFYRGKERYKEPERLAQARGSAVHEVIEEITKVMIADPDHAFTVSEVRAFVVAAILRHPAAYEETEVIVQMAKDYIRKPPRLLTPNSGLELRLAVKHEGDTFVECDYEDPEAFGRGRADLMDISDDTTEALVTDHKTQPNIEEADTFQMGFYSWIIKKANPFLDKVSTILHFVRFSYYSNPYVWTAEDLARVEDEIITRVHILESTEDWSRAVPNKLCQYCPFLGECPALKEFVEVDSDGQVHVLEKNFEILGDTAKAVKLAGLVQVLSNIAKVAKDNLKAHVKSAGPIAIPGVIYEFRPGEGIDWKKVNKNLRKETYAVFEKHKVDPKPFMSFNQTVSKFVWTLGNEALVRELAALFPRVTATKFEGYKG